jgi:hypothetical protein
MPGYRLSGKADSDLKAVCLYGVEKFGKAQAYAAGLRFVFNCSLNNPALAKFDLASEKSSGSSFTVVTSLAIGSRTRTF